MSGSFKKTNSLPVIKALQNNKNVKSQKTQNQTSFPKINTKPQSATNKKPAKLVEPKINQKIKNTFSMLSSKKLKELADDLEFLNSIKPETEKEIFGQNNQRKTVEWAIDNENQDQLGFLEDMGIKATVKKTKQVNNSYTFGDGKQVEVKTAGAPNQMKSLDWTNFNPNNITREQIKKALAANSKQRHMDEIRTEIAKHYKKEFYKKLNEYTSGGAGKNNIDLSAVAEYVKYTRELAKYNEQKELEEKKAKAKQIMERYRDVEKLFAQEHYFDKNYKKEFKEKFIQSVVIPDNEGKTYLAEQRKKVFPKGIWNQYGGRTFNDAENGKCDVYLNEDFLTGLKIVELNEIEKEFDKGGKFELEDYKRKDGKLGKRLKNFDNWFMGLKTIDEEREEMQEQKRKEEEERKKKEEEKKRLEEEEKKRKAEEERKRIEEEERKKKAEEERKKKEDEEKRLLEEIKKKAEEEKKRKEEERKKMEEEKKKQDELDKIKEELDKLKKENEALNQSNNNLKNDLDSKNKDLNTQKEHNAKLTQDLKDKNKDFENTKQQLEKQEKTVKKLEEENKVKISQLEEKDAKLAEKETAINKHKEKLKEQENKLKKQEDENLILKTENENKAKQIQEQKEHNAKLTQDLEAKNNDLVNTKQQLEKQEETAKQLAEANEHKDKELEAKNNIIQQNEETIKQHVEENQKLVDDNNNQKTKIKEQENANKQLQTELLSLKNVNAIQEQKNQELVKSLNEEKDKNNSLTNVLNSKTKELEEEKKRSDQLEVENKNKENQIKEQQATNIQLQHEKEALNKDFESEKKRREDAEKDNAIKDNLIQEKNATLEEKNTAIKQQEEKLKEQEEKLKEQEENATKLAKENQEKENQLKKQEDENLILKTENENKAKQIQEQKEHNAKLTQDLEAKNNDFENTKQQLEKQGEMVKKLEEEKKATISQLEEKNTAIKQQEEKLKEQEENVTKLAKENQDKDNVLKEKENKIKNLSTLLEDMKKTQSKLNQTIDSLQNKISENVKNHSFYEYEAKKFDKVVKKDKMNGNSMENEDIVEGLTNKAKKQTTKGHSESMIVTHDSYDLDDDTKEEIEADLKALGVTALENDIKTAATAPKNTNAVKETKNYLNKTAPQIALDNSLLSSVNTSKLLQNKSTGDMQIHNRPVIETAIDTSVDTNIDVLREGLLGYVDKSLGNDSVEVYKEVATTLGLDPNSSNIKEQVREKMKTLSSQKQIDILKHVRNTYENAFLSNKDYDTKVLKEHGDRIASLADKQKLTAQMANESAEMTENIANSAEKFSKYAERLEKEFKKKHPWLASIFDFFGLSYSDEIERIKVQANGLMTHSLNNLEAELATYQTTRNGMSTSLTTLLNSYTEHAYTNASVSRADKSTYLDSRALDNALNDFESKQVDQIHQKNDLQKDIVQHDIEMQHMYNQSGIYEQRVGENDNQSYLQNDRIKIKDSKPLVSIGKKSGLNISNVDTAGNSYTAGANTHANVSQNQGTTMGV